MQGIGAEAAGHPFIHDDDARAGANLPAARVVYPIHCILVHQEESVSVLLDAGLQPIRSGYRPIASSGLAALKKNSSALLPADDETGLHDFRKHKNGDGFRFGLS